MKSLSDLQIPLPLAIEYKRENKKIVHTLRIEEDKFEVCVSKEVRKKKLFREEVWLVHRLKDGGWDMEEVKQK